MSIVIAPATPADQAAIVALVRSERLNPNGLRAERFLVAKDGARVVGAAQMREHPGGALELGSLVVAPSYRGRRIAGRLIGQLLSAHSGRIFVITREIKAHHWAPFGFTPVNAWQVPAPVRWNCTMGRIAGGVFGLVRGRWPQRLVILQRDGGQSTPPLEGARVSSAKMPAG